MSGYDNTNRGILSKNDRKQSDKHPDITGTINVEGVDYFLDGWMKERNDGSGSFYSLSVKRKDKQPQQEAPRQTSGGYGAVRSGQTAARDMDDEIPFGPEVR